uniref:Calponin-homology (CH) domain-containing protein n=1 Tax=Spongospora subterranea TaxID=70186 RepID=A0A0H5QJU7_9EUKA|eukprot:CRZ02273.1 hypothetical protein [Spongospora subterranea]
MVKIRQPKIGRDQLLSAANKFLETDYTSLSDFHDGVGYAQILHACFLSSDVVPMHRLEFKAQTKRQVLKNLTIVEKVLGKLGITRRFPVHEIAEGSATENYEFLKWCWIELIGKLDSATEKYRALEFRIHAQEQQRNHIANRNHTDAELSEELRKCEFEAREMQRDTADTLNPDAGQDASSLITAMKTDIIMRLSQFEESMAKTAILMKKKEQIYNTLKRVEVV